MCKCYLPKCGAFRISLISIFDRARRHRMQVLLTEATELHANLLGATSFHMYEQYAYFWHGLASYMHVYTCPVITE